MEFSRIAARGQTTIPKRRREAAGLREDDLVAFDRSGDHFVLRKVEIAPEPSRDGVFRMMDEWGSPEDEDAWRDL